jgi:hypothetical protein
MMWLAVFLFAEGGPPQGPQACDTCIKIEPADVQMGESERVPVATKPPKVEPQEMVKVEDEEEEMEEHEEHESYTTFTLHRWMGYGIILGSLTNAALGLYELNLYQNGQTPGDYVRIPHRAIGYTVFSLSLIQSSIGTYNAIKLMDEEEGSFRRIVHGLLAWGATGAYLYAGYLGYRGYYEQHRNWMLVATGLATLTGLWIIF